MCMPKDLLEQSITLPNGRRIGYAEFGDLKGIPVFHFHGLPGSRLEGNLLGNAAKTVGVRLISVDRPGMGLSDFLPNRRIADWPVDVNTLANALGLETFAIEGFSGGGPYAVACAVFLPYRVIACGLISSAGPKGIELGTRWNSCLPPSDASIRKMMDGVSRAWSGFAQGCRNLTSASRFVENGLGHIFPADPDVILGRDRTVQENFAADFCEAFRQGIRGEIHEDYLRNMPWNFNLSEISSQVPVFLWHGELDANVPLCVGRAIARCIPHCKTTFYHKDGHISVPYFHAIEILRSLKEAKNVIIS
ncbi:MAG: alpha/beta hydrolase [Promethearchaeota archaeon CR_4]|nr:MAG: alpha/beta hydrolase [Candidatus Lokiarchaeota archaeon CR_4]